MYPFNYRQAASPNFGELLTLGCGLYSPALRSTDASIKINSINYIMRWRYRIWRVQSEPFAAQQREQFEFYLFMGKQWPLLRTKRSRESQRSQPNGFKK